MLMLLAPLAVLLPRLLASRRNLAYAAPIALGLLSRMLLPASPVGDVLMSLLVMGGLNVFCFAEVIRERRMRLV